MTTITIQINLPDQFIYDVLTIAVEGGINYWAVCSEINRDAQYGVISAVLQDLEWHMTHARCEATCRMAGAPKGATCEEYDQIDFRDESIDYDTVVAGLTDLLAGRVEVAPYIREYIERGIREGDAGEIDAEAADAIIQAGLFGELVYG